MGRRLVDTVCGTRRVVLSLPGGWSAAAGSWPAVLLQDGAEAAALFSGEELEALFPGPRPPVLAFLYAGDRLAEYTPWPAAAMSSRFPDFPGRGGAYLMELERVCLPWLEAEWGVDRTRCSLLGYSIGGLICTYALTVQTCWRSVASLCGSFWYEGWLAYLAAHPPLRRDAAVLLHYGTGEGTGKTTRMRDAAACAQETGAYLVRRLPGRVRLTWDKGGHHSFVKARYAAALRWLAEG